MASDHSTNLRGIPGAGSPGRSRRRSGPSAGRQFRPPLIDDPRRSRPEPRRRFRRSRGPKAWSPRRQPRSIPWSTLLIALGFAALGFFIWQKFWDATRVDVIVTGIEDQAKLTLDEASDLDVEIDIEQLDLEAGVTPTLFFDGVELDDETHEISDTGITWNPEPLDEGVHVLAMSIGRPLLDDAKFTWTFAVDATPPVIDVVSPQPAVPICTPVTVSGSIEAGLASFQIDGEDAEVDEDGTFTLAFDQAPLAPILLTAEDQAGNTAAAEIVIPVEYPSTQGIHVTAAAWGYDPLREHVLDMSMPARSRPSNSTSRTRAGSSATTPTSTSPTRSAPSARNTCSPTPSTCCSPRACG